jgi:hypothetical protein
MHATGSAHDSDDLTSDHPVTGRFCSGNRPFVRPPASVAAGLRRTYRRRCAACDRQMLSIPRMPTRAGNQIGWRRRIEIAEGLLLQVGDECVFERAERYTGAGGGGPEVVGGAGPVSRVQGEQVEHFAGVPPI